MCLFFRNKTRHREEMCRFLKEYMLEYIDKNPSAADDIIPIFSNAAESIQNSTERQIHKLLRTNHINEECAALNIVHNFAACEITQRSPVDFIIHASEDSASALYKYINDIKYNKGYISKQQYDENRLTGTKFALRPPWGNWH